MQKNNDFSAKPFLKWAGGKTQLLDEFDKRLPSKIKGSKFIETYIEPFIGGGAMFFFLKRKYDIKKSFIFDINPELIIAYKVIQGDYKALIDRLSEIKHKHLQKSEDMRKEYYYQIRDKYNKQIENFNYSSFNDEWIERAAYLIFLNKTCFNGLFRQNRKGEFNVPFGRYKNPSIYDEENIIKVNKALKNTEIFCGDFTSSSEYIQKDSFVYLDPPYRPLNRTSSFTSYSKDGFFDEDQVRLSMFFEQMDKQGTYLMLSNSDPKNKDINDHFFDDLYKNYNINRIPAKRHINSDASKRGKINELIITNYVI
ncbi:DNA adenine methylase [Methanobacterium sp.]|uniref:DNA adenine methylase n=1 Tax=Methanobacterium sp. TaxID=2164 RepID=UPI0031590394